MLDPSIFLFPTPLRSSLLLPALVGRLRASLLSLLSAVTGFMQKANDRDWHITRVLLLLLYGGGR